MINTGKHLWHVDDGLATSLHVTDDKHWENTYGMLMMVWLPCCRLLTINTGKHLWHVDAGLMQVTDEKHLENTSGMLTLVLLPTAGY